MVALLAGALMVGLATASDYGISIDEFNADDYGPKALAWYTSGFTDRSHFETVEFSLWYYGPWFHMLTSFVQSFDLADRFTVRHAMTFLVGLGGLAALLPIGRLAAGRWAGLTAIALCLMTGYLYGSLFFTPIDVPFLAAMTWATLAIMVMSRQVLPSWRATVAVGLTTGLAIATRTGGIITHVYLIGALVLCAAEFFAVNGRLTGTLSAAAWRPLCRRCCHSCRHSDRSLALAADRKPAHAVHDRVPPLRGHSDVLRVSPTGASVCGPMPCRSSTFRSSSARGCRMYFFSSWRLLSWRRGRSARRLARDLLAVSRTGRRAGLRALAMCAGTPARHPHRLCCRRSFRSDF